MRFASGRRTLRRSYSRSWAGRRSLRGCCTRAWAALRGELLHLRFLGVGRVVGRGPWLGRGLVPLTPNPNPPQNRPPTKTPLQTKPKPIKPKPIKPKPIVAIVAIKVGRRPHTAPGKRILSGHLPPSHWILFYSGTEKPFSNSPRSSFFIRRSLRLRPHRGVLDVMCLSSIQATRVARRDRLGALRLRMGRSLQRPALQSLSPFLAVAAP